MLRPLLASAFVSIALLLSACGDGDAGTPAAGAPPPTVSASGNVVKGIIRNGIVSAWRWEEGAYVKVASARTGGDGVFVLTIPAPVPGEVLRLQLDASASTVDGERTEMLCDVAQCGSAVRGEWAPLASGLGLASWASVGADSRVTLMPMTALSTLLVSHAEQLGGGRLTLASVDVARLRVAGLVGLSPDQLLARPGNILDTLWLEAATPEAVKVAALSAAMAELATLNSQTIDQVLADFAERFNAQDGRLLQAGDSQSLESILQAVASLAAGNPVLQGKLEAWVNTFVAGLRSGELNTSLCGTDCGDFDSNSVIAALGTGSDKLGGDLLRLMAAQGVTHIEDLIAAQLARYGWLAHQDSLALAGVAWNVAAVSALNAVGAGGVSIPGLAVVREGNTVHFDGSFNGFAVDLDVSVPQLLQQLNLWTPGSPAVFTIGVAGTVENARVRGRLDGTLVIDASATDFGPVKSALQSLFTAMQSQDPVAGQAAQAALLQAVGGIIRRGAATFTLQGEAALAKLEQQEGGPVETSLLGISGRGVLDLDMDGLAGGSIRASGRADYGTLTLPNGDTFRIDPEQGHALTFALDADGSAVLKAGAHVLGEAATLSGNGRLAGLGALLNHLRDGAATIAETGVLNADPLLAQLLTDLRTLQLTVSGQAVIPGYGHTYTLTIANGVLKISQPDSSETALELALLARGLMARAGSEWWMLGVDLANPYYPALTLADSRGAQWRWDFNFTGLVADAGTPATSSPESDCGDPAGCVL